VFCFIVCIYMYIYNSIIYIIYLLYIYTSYSVYLLSMIFICLFVSRLFIYITNTYLPYCFNQVPSSDCCCLWDTPSLLTYALMLLCYPPFYGGSIVGLVVLMRIYCSRYWVLLLL
jgi:hypothetical protein